MDILDRLLGCARWGTESLLKECEVLTEAQLDQEFDIGWRTIRKTFEHIIDAYRLWGYHLGGAAYQRYENGHPLLLELQQEYAGAFDVFETGARLAVAEERMNTWFVDIYNFPQSTGGTILQALLHNIMHLSDITHMLRRMGVDIPDDRNIHTWEASLRS